MPSVGMRRTTRVFGVVKGFDGARVLRSGRRLWPEHSSASKHTRAQGGDEWCPLIIDNKENRGHGSLKPNWWAHDVKKKQEVTKTTHVNETKARKTLKSKVFNDKCSGDRLDKMCGIVYERKRKRLVGQKSEFDGDKMFGIQFSRRQRMRESESLVGFTGIDDSWGLLTTRAFGVVVPIESSCFFSCFLNSLLRYMRSDRVQLSRLAAFLLAPPISGSLALRGIHFSWDPPSNGTGVCKFFGTREFIPVFSVDFSALPLCFLSMHGNMLLRLEFLHVVLVNKLMGVHTDEVMEESIEEEEEEEEDQQCVLSETVLSGGKVMAPDLRDYGNQATIHPTVIALKSLGRSSQYRNGLNSRSIQKRRSSLRRRRARSPSLFRVQNANGALVSDLLSSRRNGIPFSSIVSKNKLRTSVRSSAAAAFKEVSSTTVGLTQEKDSSCCTANLLIIGSDRCYREEGLGVMLDVSASGEWLLAVKKDGLTRHTLKAEKIMRPPSCNRYTHAIIWIIDDSWKLEFPNRLDWATFKDLYKECSDRNVPASVAKVIPVPGVREVSNYDDFNTAPFRRPDSYISTCGDEVSRAMGNRNANYDMDSEDEEWLNNLNAGFFTESELHEHNSANSFESMVDAFEKAFYCSPDDLTDEKAAANLCLDLGRRQVVEAVYSYWMKKRKQKRSALLRVFQGQVKRPSLIPKPALRKRRSFKRQASQSGRSKQPRLLQAMAAERDAWDEQTAMQKVEEAKLLANKSIELAILKRQRAQSLMENAGLATYKATMVLRIAEAAGLSESSDAAVAHFLDFDE
ncbi:EPL1 domain-containing protein [Cephalotus follicularis]|uniref:Enhancer of polycomb-like protein n=1 Tax=Cephalotus follicularis TaxID=3775 RepID=A0A1Q3CH10_CEPFO|nr:EPL1 domain-containing protein [Cephalotus follicularis]